MAKESDSRRLVVGRDIRLFGEIKACDALVVEGRVEANLADGQSLEIAELGIFVGGAVVDNCEIRGTFEGDLVVHGLLVLHDTARVSGTVYYGNIEIARGARIRGTVDQVEDDPSRSHRDQPAEEQEKREPQQSGQAGMVRIKPQFPKSMTEILATVENEESRSATSGHKEAESDASVNPQEH